MENHESVILQNKEVELNASSNLGKEYSKTCATGVTLIPLGR